MLPRPFSHSKQRFAASAWAVLFSAKPLSSLQAPLGACSELRGLYVGTKGAMSLLCPLKYANNSSDEPHSTSCLYAPRKPGQGQLFLHTCMMALGGRQTRESVLSKGTSSKKECDNVWCWETHPAPPVVEFRWDMPNTCGGKKLGLEVLESNFTNMVFRNLNLQIVNNDLWRELCKLSSSSWWDGIIYYFNFSD